MSKEFWENCEKLEFNNESEVETKLVLPLLEALGYDRYLDIRNQKEIDFTIYEGRKKSKGIADFIVYGGQPLDKNTALITIEAKSPKVLLKSAKKQAESYAFNYGTPFILLCNGLSAQLWQLQISKECNLLLEIKDGEYLRNKGLLEAYLSKRAAMKHSECLYKKEFNYLINDFSEFHKNELLRLDNSNNWLDRNIYPMASGSGEPLSKVDFLHITKPIVVIARSGFGKTTLAKLIGIEALERRVAGEKVPLPINIPLPELVSSDQSIKEFVLQRISAHQPSISEANFPDLVREQGLLLIADGMNRISEKSQLKIVSDMNAMLRDFPDLKLVIFSSNVLTSVIEKALYYNLGKFNRDELDALAERLGVSKMMWVGAPAAIYGIAKVPVLAMRIVQKYKSSSSYVQKIDELFENWIEDSLVGQGQIKRTLLKDVLFKIAIVTRDAAIPVSDFVKIHNDISILEDLFTTGLVTMNGNSLELVHETLATYLRAVDLVNKMPSEVDAYLREYATEENHLFSAILMSTAPTWSKQKSIWSSILKSGLTLAIGATRYRYDLSKQLCKSTSDEKSKIYLSDIVEAIEEPARIYFSSYIEEIFAELCGDKANVLGISGKIKGGVANYSFFDASNDKPKVLVRDDFIVKHSSIYMDNLFLKGLRTDSGRIIGLSRLFKVINNLSDRRKIRGGHSWRIENCLGKFMCIAQVHGISELSNSVDLQSAIDLLNPHKGKKFDYASHWDADSFSVSELISDMQMLIKSGVTYLRPWWYSGSEIDLHNIEGREAYTAMVNEYYYRSQVIYFELVSSLPNLLPFIKGLNNRPHKYSVMVYHKGERSHIRWKRYSMPVASFLDAGAEVYYEEDERFLDPTEDLAAYSERYQQALIEAGRFSDKWSWSYGVGLEPDFSQEHTFSRKRYETSAMNLAYEWLKRDIKGLFQELPNTDTGINY